MDTEKSLIAERAAEWLEQLEHAGPDERARFVKWLKESPQHGWEILLATSTNIAAKQLMKEAGFKATNTEGQPANLLSMDPRRSRAPKTESPQLRSWSNMLIGRRLVAVIAFLAITSLVSAAGVICTDMADENCTFRQVGDSVSDRGVAHVRKGATSAVTSLSGAGADQG